jgi:hypothetical protein
MSEKNLNNPNSIPEHETLPVNEEVRLDFHQSNLISYDALKQREEAERLAEAAHPQVEKEIAPPTERDLIDHQSGNLFLTRRRRAAMVAPEVRTDLKKTA